MTDYFLDSSAVVKKYVDEPGSDVVRRLLASRDNRLHVAHITLVEVVAALHRRTHRRDIDARTGRTLMDGFRAELPRLAHVITVSPERVEAAAALAATHLLRGHDAVLLAVAAHVNALARAEGCGPVTLVSADAELNVAAEAENLRVLDPTA